MKKSSLLTPILTLFVILNLFSQRETENWYFGNKAALKYNDNERPTALLNSIMNAPFGSATISDKNGVLLFYTSGTTVYNANHSPMQNGVLLASDNEVLQTSIIIPKPNSPNLYFLITLKDNNDPPPPIGTFIPPGLYYSLIDMNENNGLGAVVKKNLFLTSLVSEKLTAVHAKDGKSIWVITFGKQIITSNKFDTFYSFKIDENGINTAPVTSSISATVLNNKGALKASPNAEHLLLSNNNSVILTDFNNETGKISTYNYLTISTSIVPPPSKAYGVEFSNDSKYAYVETIKDEENKILQYKTDNLDEIEEIHVSNKGKSYMQLANDGNIYLTTGESESTNGFFLSTITPPKNSNETIATFSENSINLDGREALLGLPNFIQSYFRTRIKAENGCLNTKTLFEIDSYAAVTAANWDFGDGNTSTEIMPEHIFTTPGFHFISCTITVNNREIFIYKDIEIFTPSAYTISNNEMIQCDTDNNGTDFFNLTAIKDNIQEFKSIQKMSFYKSLADAQDNIDEISDAGNYENTGRNEIFVRIYNEQGCYTIKSFFIESAFVQIGVIKDYFTCTNLDATRQENTGIFNLASKQIEIRSNLNLNNNIQIRFYPSALSAQLTQDELPIQFTSKTAVVWVRLDTPIGCGGIASFNLVVNQLPKTNKINNSYTICFNPSLKPPIIISANASNNRFEWQDSLGKIISTNKDFTLNTTGDYSLTVYRTINNIECSNTKSFTVINPEIPTISNVLVNTEDETNNIVAVTVSGNSSYEFSLDNVAFFSNATSYTFSEVTPGLRTIYIKDIDNCESPIQQTVSVLGFKDFFTPNGDGKNDFWNIKGLDAQFYKGIQIQIYNRLGKMVGVINNFDSLGWDGTYNGKLQISNSYWYRAKIIDINDNIIKKTGNFSLIRK